MSRLSDGQDGVAGGPAEVPKTGFRTTTIDKKLISMTFRADSTYLYGLVTDLLKYFNDAIKMWLKTTLLGISSGHI